MTVFYLTADMPSEAVLFAASIARVLRDAVPLAILEEEPIDLVERDAVLSTLREMSSEARPAARVVVWEDHEPPPGVRFGETWHLSPIGDGSTELRLDTPRARHRFPLAMSPEIVKRDDRIESETHRLLLPLTAGNPRREKMALRTLEELRRRKFAHLLVAVGEATPDRLRALDPDEHYAHPTAGELAALMMSSSSVLELSDESAPPSGIARLARCVATRVVLHASSSLAHSFSPELRVSHEWSPDAFCDLVTVTSAEEQELPWGTEFEAIAEDFGRILRIG